MASLVKTYKGDLSTAIAKRLLSAYFNWEDENYIAQGEPGSNASSTPPSGNVPPSTPPSGGGTPPRSSSALVPVRKVGPSRNVDPRIVKLTNLINNPAATAGEKAAARNRLNYITRKGNIPQYERGFFPRNFNSGIKVTDEKLGVFLQKLALSLSSSINTINQKLDSTGEVIQSTKDGVDQTYKKLEQHSDSLESKLDGIIEALRYSGQVEKEKRDQREAETKIAQQKEEVDLSNTNRILMQDMDRQEIRDLQRENLADDIADDAAGQNEDNMMDDLPQLAEGGIVSGPDSGYLAVLHGDEAVIPLDNNYTQGQPSAVGQTPISEMPMMAERGINPGENLPSMKPEFTPSVNVSTPMINRSPSLQSGNGDLLAKAIELPTKAAGLVTMGVIGKVLQSVGLPPSIIANMKAISSPIAQAFGIPDVMSSNIASDIEAGQRISQERSDFRGKSKTNKEKGLFGRFKDWITGKGGSSYGRGGSFYGRGGSTTYNRMNVNGTGGYGVGPFWGGKKDGKNIIDKMKYDPNHPDGTSQQNPHPPGTMLYNVFEKHRQYDQMGILRSSTSGGDSQFFAKNVTYDNAFDYYKSPEYGLKTSNIAYNMSMEDEVNNIIDGLTDPQSQVVMNNTNNSSAGKQIEYSAIAVRGNPLKEGTYVSPYSV